MASSRVFTSLRSLPRAPQALRARKAAGRWRPPRLSARRRNELRRDAVAQGRFQGVSNTSSIAAPVAAAAPPQAAHEALFDAEGWDAAWDRPRRVAVPKPQKGLARWVARKHERNAMILKKVAEADGLIAVQKAKDKEGREELPQYYEDLFRAAGFKNWDIVSKTPQKGEYRPPRRKRRRKGRP